MAQFLAEIRNLFALIKENRKHLQQRGGDKEKAKPRKTILNKAKPSEQRRKIASVATTKA